MIHVRGDASPSKWVIPDVGVERILLEKRPCCSGVHRFDPDLLGVEGGIVGQLMPRISRADRQDGDGKESDAEPPAPPEEAASARGRGGVIDVRHSMGRTHLRKVTRRPRGGKGAMPPSPSPAVCWTEPGFTRLGGEIPA